MSSSRSFNTQPPEGGWGGMALYRAQPCNVSTHSRLKAAGNFTPPKLADLLFQHTAA